MIKWNSKFNLTKAVLIFGMGLSIVSPAFSENQTIIPNVEPVVEDCPEGTNVIPTCLRDRITPTNAAELISGDLGVCRCIEKTKGNVLGTAPSTTPNSEEESRKYKQRKVNQLGAIVGSASVLNSTSYSSSKVALNNNLIGFGAGEVRAQLAKNPVSIDGVRILPPEINGAFARIGHIPPENVSWQCVSIQEYQAHRTIPSDNNFYQMLKSASFSPSEWNETTLKTQFDTANDTERENIRQKLIFLSRNPIFKAILKAQPTEAISAEVIASKQNQLLQSIQKLKPAENSTCFTRPNGCWRELQGNGKINEFKADAMAFTNDPIVHDISSAQNAKTYMDELRRLSEQGQIVGSSNIPTTPEGYFAYMQSANSSLARRCAGTNVEASCYTAFANHCSNLQVIDARVRTGLRVSSSELSDQLFEEEAIHAEMDPNTNPAFREFNDSICLQTFANAEGVELNYFQYQTAHCSGENRFTECSDRKKLLARFLREHNSGSDEVATSVRNSFGELVENNEYVDATAAQIATANNISESPAQIRARFGGGYPTITPKGDIVAAVSSVASSSGNPSSEADTSSGVSSGTVGVVAPVSGQDNRIQSRIPSSAEQADLGSQNPQNYVMNERKPTPTFFGALNRFETKSNPVVQAQDQVVPNFVQPSNDAVIVNQENRTPDTSIVTSSGSAAVVPSILSSNGSAGRKSGLGGGSSNGSTSVNSQTKSQAKTPQNLNFKYGLNRDGTAVQPDVQIVPVVDTIIPVTLDQSTVDRIKSNPASLVLSSSQISEILANPNVEVPIQIKTKGGESVLVYAKKDASGNLSYSLESASNGRSPASSGSVVRAKLSSSIYETVLNDPDTVLNQNEDLVNELAKREDGSTIVLQIVSDGKRALTFEVTKKDDLLYHYRLKR